MKTSRLEYDAYARFLQALARVHNYSYPESSKSVVRMVLGCADCGTHQGRLDFDHRDKQTKRFKINASLGYSWTSIRNEIAKCDVRCAPCHTRRHHRDHPGFSVNHRWRVL